MSGTALSKNLFSLSNLKSKTKMSSWKSVKENSPGHFQLLGVIAIKSSERMKITSWTPSQILQKKHTSHHPEFEKNPQALAPPDFLTSVHLSLKLDLIQK